MIKRLSLATCFLFVVISLPAQFDTSYVKKNIRNCADSMMVGFKTRNWDLFTRYSYPALVGSMGGTKGFSSYIAETFSAIPDSAWKKYESGKILQVVKAGKDLQTIIEQHTILEWQGYRIRSTSYLIGESWDGGQFWTFFDSQGDAAASRQINAALSPALIIPKTIETQEPLTTQSKKKQGQR